MRRARPLLLWALATACAGVPIDDARNDKRLFPPRGVIRGTVTYVGPRPCSRGGHIVGSAVVLVFDRRNPPPPTGLATTAVNFVAVPGDVLFANEPRSTEGELFCPDEATTVEASSPFTVAPVEGGSYVVAAFYDRRGRFWPTFKLRNLPEAGDLAGGFVDVEDARRHEGDLGYTPLFRAVDVGIPQPGPEDEIPDYEIGPGGYVADNVPVAIGRVVPFTRPYFHPQRGEDSSEKIGEALSSPANEEADPLSVPILSIPEDVQILAPPSAPTPETLTAYQRGFPSLDLVFGVAAGEFDAAVDPRRPFGFQLPPLPPQGRGGLVVFARGGAIPESPAVPALWPQVALVKLADDPRRRAGDVRPLGDPQSLVVQGSLEETLITGKPPGPLVVLQGITLLDGSLARTIAGPVPSAADTSALRDRVTALIRPAAICFDARRTDRGGLLVTPHLTAASADPVEVGPRPLFDPEAIAALPLVRAVRQGCLPRGRYAISLVYPTGQAWTVPNESGGCAPAEGAVQRGEGLAACAGKPRTVLLSQGSRAVVEIAAAGDPAVCEANPVPPECLPP